MKLITPLLLLLISGSLGILNAQSNEWMTFELNSSAEMDGFFAKHPQIFRLPDGSKMIKTEEVVDELGIVHSSWQQQHNGIPILFSDTKLHWSNGRLRVNGKQFQRVATETTAGITAEDAVNAALNHIGADTYAWQSSNAEIMLKRIKKDPSATYYPKPELKLVPIEDLLTLAWEMEIFALEPHTDRMLYVDANNGSILLSLELMCDQNSTGSGTTRYSGPQTFITDSISPSYFRLRDYSRGGGIETFNAQQFESVNLPDSATDFIDFTNTWIVDDSIKKDDAALDVHWGLQESYDYFFNEHSRNSWDGNGITMIAYVHVGSAWFNARFNGRWMEFGDGSGHPLTSIDVVAHEMTHGVTRSSAGLIYRVESGALNESFSDIFGAEVENWALPDSSDYLIGKENFTFRNMADPNSYGHPDTYMGAMYYTGPSDNGGVHTNSGVQNFWFYLLSQGGSGTNDNGDNYSVTAIGRTSAAQIAYRNLNHYLTPDSKYIDARQGALAAAEDLFGPCSFEVDQVLNAWYAVGVGADSIDPDIRIIDVTSPSTDCNLTASEDVTFSFKFLKSGCGDMLLPGDSVHVTYEVDQTPVTETIFFSDTVFGGDTITYTFVNQADLSNRKTYNLDVYLHLPGDIRGANDSLLDMTITHPIRVENELITFEDAVAVVDSFYTITGDHSLVSVAIFGNPDPGGINGLRMTGDDPDHDSSFDIPTSAIDIWTKNPDYYAATCFCVDASAWADAHLYFDLKQTFSKWYLQEYGFDLPNQASTMRVSVDGTPVTGDFHPDTYISDPYENYHLDLSAYAGSQFELCFETMNFVKFEEDPWAGSEGDNAYLDNIWLGDHPLEINQLTPPEFEVFPNPATESLSISGDHRLNGDTKLQLTDALGKVYYTGNLSVSGSLNLDISHLAPGIYFLNVSHDGLDQSKKIVIQ